MVRGNFGHLFVTVSSLDSQVLSGYIEIPSQRSYLTEPITIHYRALAKTLQANAIVLEHRQQFQKDCTDYKSFLANVSNSLDVGDHHVRVCYGKTPHESNQSMHSPL